ncbi:hypothetical protein [Secundilactobacillus similis]|uniref:YopX protein domain-containing protein n=1 Tax=Secundilactobacillus similis DSM 23365 = JCM 2765 TaxID=1423804 RepID=A0A0R2EYC9_9LACO|nr:hypothetical protein [Secundilactobacillus similis]KRN20646.1 hypothetical protein FD14_GL001435 [Secundilactobacillus similis DSM 23365 = JCM 2765]
MVKDNNGNEIKYHDVLINEDGVIGFVVSGTNFKGKTTLGVVNSNIGLNDKLETFPDGVWEIVGNLETGKELEEVR